MKFIPYLKALSMLSKKLAATPEEISGWILLGKEEGGLDAYVNPYELRKLPNLNNASQPPTDSRDECGLSQVDRSRPRPSSESSSINRRAKSTLTKLHGPSSSNTEVGEPVKFSFAPFQGNPDYLHTLAHCWFPERDISNFRPSSEVRFITGRNLLERWKSISSISPRQYIIAKVEESNLLDLHPTMGGFGEVDDIPPIEDCLFFLSHVSKLEREEISISDVPRTAIASTDLEGVLRTPKRQDDWFLAIQDTVREFIKEQKRTPTRQEAWTRLQTNPPHGHGITCDDTKREPAILMNGRPLYLSNFKERWDRYFPQQ